MSSFKLLSHPGKLLVDHLGNVLANGRLLWNRLGVTPELEKVLELSLILHDLGKATDYFQEYIGAVARYRDGTLSLKERNAVEKRLGYLKNHARISAVWGLILARRLFGEEAKEPIYVFLAILKHHGHLGNFEEMLVFPKTVFGETLSLRDALLRMSQHLDYAEMGRILAENGFSFPDFGHEAFAAQLQKFFSARWWIRVSELEDNLEMADFYNLSLVFSILLGCDKGECIFNGIIYRRSAPKLPADLVTRYKALALDAEDTPLNRMRERVYASVEARLRQADPARERFFSINVPTGIGKTFTVLNAALDLLARRENLEKIVYCLPFTSVIDQNGQVIEEILRRTGHETHSEHLVLLHHLAELKYRAKDDRGELDDYQGEYLVNQFESLISVTTFYQLLHGILTGRNREIRKLHGLARSIVILDEVQSIPAKYWPLVRQVFRDLARRLDMVFILVTATMPLIFSEEAGEIHELVADKKEIFLAMDRIQLDCGLLQSPMGLEEFAEHLRGDILAHPGSSFLAILNTRASAAALYDLLEPDFGDRLLFLSSDVTPRDRLNRIQTVKGEGGRKGLIAVSTQLVEAGVDIDLHHVYRDLAPLDAVFQAAGRCNRNAARGPGTVFVVDLVNESGRGYASFIYDAFNLSATRKLLATRPVFPESSFLDLAHAYYKEVRDKGVFRESLDLLAQMRRLNYGAAFHSGEIRGEKKLAPFRLIEESATVSAFVCVEKEAKDLYRTYLDLVRQPVDPKQPFDKKNHIRRHLKKMAPFMVSLRLGRGTRPEKEEDQTFFVLVADGDPELPEADPCYGYHPVKGVFQRDQLFF